MATAIHNRVQAYRTARGWSQEDLARRTGLSRAAISAIETDRVVPSTAAALAVAHTFGCSVENLFTLTKMAPRGGPQWAWQPNTAPNCFWQAALGDETRLYPVERTYVGTMPPDGIAQANGHQFHAQADPEQTLVLAGCDPAVGLLAAELTRGSDTRLVPFIRSSRQALRLLRDGLVHVAGLHLQDDETPDGNERAVRDLLGSGYTLLRLSSWQEGLAADPSLHIKSIRAAVAANLRWVGREPGSGARRCLDALFKDCHPLPKGYHHVARDHVGVAETIRSGWAQAGICVRLSAAEAGLDFLVVREEDYDLCYRSEMERDPRLQALIRAVRSRALRRLLGELPGYDTSEMGNATVVVN